MARKKKETLVKEEVARLRELFSGIPPGKVGVVEGLINQAARLRIMLDEMWVDISQNGDTELFSQSEKCEPYERERPVARLFNARDKNYQQVIRQLLDLLPEEEKEDPAGELMRFVSRSRNRE
ncbi:hypothetical protein SAMN04515656_11216 [Eubacterium aggregans]|uniref:Uncharacterized protein n=1 Tax=Eubacterium aggregans TaxID=81409 RepID=A0A1H4BNW1_9FIRM|nr:hypothetical protein [Eubacterium aggregans]SEA49758.1 hypothetical protein SAMN04515656_11216 [Eubacterium aggregans]